MDLKGIQNLQCLVLAGNPVCLREGYRRRVTTQLNLRTLDDVATNDISARSISLGEFGQSESLSASGTANSSKVTSAASSAAKSRPQNITTKLLVDFKSIKDLPAPPALVSEEVGTPANEFKFGLRVLVAGFEPAIHSVFIPWQEGTMPFASKILLNFKVSTIFRDALKNKEGLTIQLVQRRMQYDLKPEPEPEEPVPGKKAKPAAAPAKKKKGAAFTAEELEAFYDAVISEERILWTRVLETKSFLDGISDRVLCDGGLPVELPQELLDELAELAAVAEAAKKKKKNAVVEVVAPLKTEAFVDIYMWPDQSMLGAPEGVLSFAMIE